MAACSSWAEAVSGEEQKDSWAFSEIGRWLFFPVGDTPGGDPFLRCREIARDAQPGVGLAVGF